MLKKKEIKFETTSQHDGCEEMNETVAFDAILMLLCNMRLKGKQIFSLKKPNSTMTLVMCKKHTRLKIEYGKYLMETIIDEQFDENEPALFKMLCQKWQKDARLQKAFQELVNEEKIKKTTKTYKRIWYARFAPQMP